MVVADKDKLINVSEVSRKVSEFTHLLGAKDFWRNSFMIPFCSLKSTDWTEYGIRNNIVIIGSG